MSWTILDFVLVTLLALALALMYRIQSLQLVRAPELPEKDPDRELDLDVGDADPELSLGAYYVPLVRQAGLDPVFGRLAYWLAKLILSLLLPLLVLETLSRWDIFPGGWLLLPLVLGFIVPDLWLLARRRTRRRRITAALSHFLDLVVSLLNAGLGLEEAFRRAGRIGFPPRHPLAQEVELVSDELDVGRDPELAFAALAGRTGVPAMVTLAAALRLGTRLGSSLQSTLEAQAELLWTRHSEDVRRRISSASVSALFPVMLCGLPLFAVLVFYPAAIDLIETFDLIFGL